MGLPCRRNTTVRKMRTEEKRNKTTSKALHRTFPAVAMADTSVGRCLSLAVLRRDFLLMSCPASWGISVSAPWGNQGAVLTGKMVTTLSHQLEKERLKMKKKTAISS